MRSRLTTKQRFELMELVKSEYATAGLGDPKFAALASERLGVEVSREQVLHARTVLGIPTSLPKRPRSPSINPTKAMIYASLELLSDRLLVLEHRISQLENGK